MRSRGLINYRSGDPNWVSSSVVDAYYIGMRFGISSVIVTAFSMLPIPILGTVLGVIVAIGVDHLITWVMETATNTLATIKSWAADVGKQIVNGWNSFTSWISSWIGMQLLAMRVTAYSNQIRERGTEQL